MDRKHQEAPAPLPVTCGPSARVGFWSLWSVAHAVLLIVVGVVSTTAEKYSLPEFASKCGSVKRMCKTTLSDLLNAR